MVGVARTGETTWVQLPARTFFTQEGAMADKELIFSARRKDFRVDTFRAGGKGGQHQNKTDSAARITHIESGISAESRSQRSQAQNKKIAFKRLVPKLVDHYCYQEQKERYGAGTEVVRSYHEPNDRVTCHVSGETFSYQHTVGKGDLEPLIRCRREAKVLENAGL